MPSMSLSERCIFVLIVIFISISCANCSKYSKKSNTVDLDLDIDFENEKRPFRMNKVNLLWTKAKKRLSGQKLADLYADLKIHDNKEAHLKKIKAEMSDRDGLKEAEVLSNYNRILRNYDLADHFVRDKNFMENEIPYDDDETKSVHFEDKKLRGMWRHAKNAGFSDEDLNILREEFWHQQMRINEFNFMRQEVSAVPDDLFDMNEEQVKSNLSPQELKEKKHSLKQRNREINEGYLKLEHMQAKFDSSKSTFKDNRVHQLWALAKKTNWTEEELEGFKDELKHFEHRLSKKTYFDEQLDLHDETKEGKSEKIKHLEQKRSDINQKVKKTHKDLKLRLEKALRHTEL